MYNTLPFLAQLSLSLSLVSILNPTTTPNSPTTWLPRFKLTKHKTFSYFNCFYQNPINKNNQNQPSTACMKPSPMAKWASPCPSISSNNHKLSCRGVNENDMVMGHLLTQKSGIDLMQNCDLPPPLKVFSGSDKVVISSMNRICNMMGQEENYDFEAYRNGEIEKLELLKALRLSQTRAREAEKKAASFAKERDSLYDVFLEDSLRIFAYRQWMRLLEFQVSKLQTKWQIEEEQLWCCCGKEGDDNGDDGVGVSWFVAFALCLGIVGVGFAFGCKYLF